MQRRVESPLSFLENQAGKVKMKNCLKNMLKLESLVCITGFCQNQKSVEKESKFILTF